MKTMTLKDIQNVSLNIMKHIHSFCIDNNIKYSLAYGTLIGAIRHKGFIPWDDDIDIIMPRKDYDQFITLYKDSKNFKLFCPERGNNYTTYARVCDISDTYVHTWAPMGTEDFGVWVDIFPLDCVDDNREKSIEKNRKLIKLNHQMFRRRSTMASLNYYGVKSIPKQIIKKMLFCKDIHKIMDEYISISRKHGSPESNHIGVLLVSIWWSENNEYFPKSILDDIINVPFEDTSFHVMKEYDLYLRTLYGDYMQLPPEEKRIGHRVHKYYWKKR